MTGLKARILIPCKFGFGFSLLLILFLDIVSADIKLTQANGDTLNLAVPVERIITLAPSLSELVFAAGAGERLIAVVEYSNFPQEVKTLPLVGNAFRIDLERIIELEPDLVIAWKSGNPQSALQKLEQLGMLVWQIEIGRPDEIADTLQDISRAAGTEVHGLSAARLFRDRLDGLRREYKDKPSLEYFFQISAQPLYTINGQHLISHGLEICGGQNIFSELATLAPQVSRESVLLANPQVLLATEIDGAATSLDVWLDWPRLDAVHNKAMLYLPSDEISQSTPRFLDSIELACQLMDEVRMENQ